MQPDKQNEADFSKIKIGGLLITLGIVYGDLGTSPLYTMQAIMQSADTLDDRFILGALSCVFWTIMLEATVKYVFITLRASNNGEGGIFSLFTMVRNKARWAFLVAIIGACALMADGVITPAITVTSSMEGLQLFSPDIPVVGLVIIILTCIFLIQPFGTKRIGKLFGPVMFTWFMMLFVLGIIPLIQHPGVLRAINPYYAIDTIIHNPSVLKLLGAVFLCTTGAEALYSDLGHVGLKNIRITWGFVSTSLLVNYFGQGAWLLSEHHKMVASVNPFFAIMPSWFLVFGVIIATMAAIIASQALITGTFTIIAEAISLNYFPKIKITYPTNLKRQMYVPKVNLLLYVCCLFVVVYFQNSTAMESAYGLSISFAMLCTSILLLLYLYKKVPTWMIVCYAVVYGVIEFSFLIANLTKFFTGGWITLLLAGVYISIMYSWDRGSRITRHFIKLRDLTKYVPILKDMKNDSQLATYTSNLVYITDSPDFDKIENTILYSILRKPKKADRYWFLQINTVDDPHTLTYKLHEIEPDLVYRIDMSIGFKEEMKVNLYFDEILEDLIAEKKINMLSAYPSLQKNNVLADFKFVIINNSQNKDYNFEMMKQLMLNYYFYLNRILVNEIGYLGLDQTISYTEQIPMQPATEIFVMATAVDSELVVKQDENILGLDRIKPES